MPITPPIFVRSDDFLVFPSVEAAESFLEPVDVEPTDRGYDSEGRLIRVGVRGEVRRGGIGIDQSGARVELSLAEDAPGHADELRAALVTWLEQVEPGTNLASDNLAALVARANRHAAIVARVDANRARWILAAAGAVLVAAAAWWLAFR
jgi:hypothetical protein